MEKMKTVNVYSREELRKWFDKNHEKEKKVQVILHKKHTGKTAPSHREQIEEAICHGWIDTTLKRRDENTYMRCFVKRNKKSKWSNNTISYAKDLVKKGLMKPLGMKYYKEGLKKPTHDEGIPKNPSIPSELKKALAKDKEAKKKFEKYSPSIKKMFYRWILRCKREETRMKRVGLVVSKVKVGNKDILTTQEKINN